MSLEIAQQALANWDDEFINVSLIAQRENKVFKVTCRSGAHYALRLHRPGYQSVAAINSELDWMHYLQTSGMDVPAPRPATNGQLLIEHRDYQIDMLSWLIGQPLGVTGEPLAINKRNQVFFDVGKLMAQLHSVSDEWQQPPGFKRMSWDTDGLLGDHPLWGRFWENPDLNSTQRARLLNIRDSAINTLSNQELDYGLIHADMVRENILVNDTSLQLIDFDDSGFGYRLFDLATALLKNRDEADFDDLQTALIEGYHSIRPLDITLLKLFMLLRAVTYVGWIMTRMNEPGANQRQQRFLSTTFELAEVTGL